MGSAPPPARGRILWRTDWYSGAASPTAAHVCLRRGRTFWAVRGGMILVCFSVLMPWREHIPLLQRRNAVPADAHYWFSSPGWHGARAVYSRLFVMNVAYLLCFSCLLDLPNHVMLTCCKPRVYYLLLSTAYHGYMLFFCGWHSSPWRRRFISCAPVWHALKFLRRPVLLDDNIS